MSLKSTVLPLTEFRWTNLTLGLTTTIHLFPFTKNLYDLTADPGERTNLASTLRAMGELNCARGALDALRSIQPQTPLQRNADDAAKLQAKIAAKAAKKSQEEGNDATGAKAPVARKKVAKKTDTLDDLLSAGLTAGKKTRK